MRAMQRKQVLNLDGSGNDKMAALDYILVSETQSDEEAFAPAHTSVNICLQLCEIAQEGDNNPDVYVTDFVEVSDPRCSDGQFKSHFRMFPAVFDVRNTFSFPFFVVVVVVVVVVCPWTSITQNILTDE